MSMTEYDTRNKIGRLREYLAAQRPFNIDSVTGPLESYLTEFDQRRILDNWNIKSELLLLASATEKAYRAAYALTGNAKISKAMEVVEAFKVAMSGKKYQRAAYYITNGRSILNYIEVCKRFDSRNE